MFERKEKKNGGQYWVAYCPHCGGFLGHVDEADFVGRHPKRPEVRILSVRPRFSECPSCRRRLSAADLSAIDRAAWTEIGVAEPAEYEPVGELFVLATPLRPNVPPEYRCRRCGHGVRVVERLPQKVEHRQDDRIGGVSRDYGRVSHIRHWADVPAPAVCPACGAKE